MPGILQTADYARAVERPYLPTDTPADVEKRVSLRMQRSAVLTRKYSPAQAEFILHEAALHTIIGSRAIMRGQSMHLADMSTRDNVSVRLLPFTAGHPGHTVATPYIIIDFPTESREPSVVSPKQRQGP